MAKEGFLLQYWTGAAWSTLSMQSGDYDISPVRHRYNDDMTLTVFQDDTVSDTPFAEGTRFRVNTTNGLIFEGVAVSVEYSEDPSSYGWMYECAGLLEEATDVIFEKDGSFRVAYNVGDSSDPDYDEDREGMTVGEILEDVFDTMSTFLPWDNYTDDPSNLTKDSLPGLDTNPGKVVFTRQSVAEIIQSFASSKEPTRRVRFKATGSTWTIVFQDTRDTRTVEIDRADMDETPLSYLFRRSRRGVYSAVKIQGAAEQKERIDSFVIGGTINMTEDWNPSFEAGWTEALADANPDTYGRVYRNYQLSQDRIMQCRLSSDGPIIAFFQRKGGVLSDLAWETVDFQTGKIRFGRPLVYDDDGVTTRYDFWVRYAYMEDPIEARFPTTNWSGQAYDEIGLERLKAEYDEDYKLITVVGETTGSSGDKLIDKRLQATPDKLVDGSLEVDGTDYGLITANSYQFLVADGSTAIGSGLSYTITLQDDTDALEEIAERLHEEVSERNTTGTIQPQSMLFDDLELGDDVNFTGFGTDDFDGVLVTDIEFNPWEDTTTAGLGTLTSLGARFEYQALKQQLYLLEQTEENQIQADRNKACRFGSTGGRYDDPDVLSEVEDHEHTQTEGDGGPLKSGTTEITNVTNTAPTEWTYDADGTVFWPTEAYWRIT